jgi:hypothetical protein
MVEESMSVFVGSGSRLVEIILEFVEGVLLFTESELVFVLEENVLEFTEICELLFRKDVLERLVETLLRFLETISKFEMEEEFEAGLLSV